MEIRPLKNEALNSYNALARQHGTLFNRADWLALFGDRIQILGIFEENCRMIGGFCLYQQRRFGVAILRNPPFTPMGGPFLEITAQNPVSILETRRKALEAMATHLDRQRFAVTRLSLDRRIVDVLPFYWRGFKAIPCYTYLVDLSVPLDQIRKNMSSERRNDISKAARDGLVVRATTDMKVVRDLVMATFGRQKMSVNCRSLDAILFRYAKSSNSYAFTTYRGDNPIATCFIVHDSQIAYYLLGGYRTEDRHHGAGAMAVFEAIKHAQEIGLRTFDFEGSVVPAIERYFRGFGGELKPYFSVNKAWLPVEMCLKLIRRNIF